MLVCLLLIWLKLVGEGPVKANSSVDRIIKVYFISGNIFDVKMQPVKILNNVQIDSVPVECYYSAFNKDKALSYEYYR